MRREEEDEDDACSVVLFVVAEDPGSVAVVVVEEVFVCSAVMAGVLLVGVELVRGVVLFFPNPMGHTAPGGYLDMSGCPEGGAAESEEEEERPPEEAAAEDDEMPFTPFTPPDASDPAVFCFFLFLPNPRGHVAPSLTCPKSGCPDGRFLSSVSSSSASSSTSSPAAFLLLSFFFFTLLSSSRNLRVNGILEVSKSLHECSLATSASNCIASTSNSFSPRETISAADGMKTTLAEAPGAEDES